MSLGGKLKKLREDKKVNLESVARSVGYSSVYISKLERGLSNNPSKETIEKLAKYYEVSPGYLLTENDDWLEMLPPKLREFVKEEGNIGYIEVIKRAKKNGWSPRALEELINVVKQVKNEE